MLLSKFRDAELREKNVLHSKKVKAFWILVLYKQLLNWLNDACEAHRVKCGQDLKEHQIFQYWKSTYKKNFVRSYILSLPITSKNVLGIHNRGWIILCQSPLPQSWWEYTTKFNMGSRFSFVSTKETSCLEAALTEVPKEAMNYH